MGGSHFYIMTPEPRLLEENMESQNRVGRQDGDPASLTAVTTITLDTVFEDTEAIQ